MVMIGSGKTFDDQKKVYDSCLTKSIFPGTFILTLFLSFAPFAQTYYMTFLMECYGILLS